MTASAPPRNKAGQGTGATQAARLAAVQALYEMEISHARLDDVVLDVVSNRWIEIPEAGASAQPDKPKFKKIVRGVSGDAAKLDEMIAGSLDGGRTPDSLDILLRNLLRAAAFELFQMPEVPAKVVVNEYLNMAHAFFSEGEPALVNGVLDRLARVLRGAEMDAK
ncbi:MAG: transcription antitermination factor NusB [Rhodospirillales bacterium]|nr:transcription antitermination factor NusB [Rhodospirillales bacterium]